MASDDCLMWFVALTIWHYLIENGDNEDCSFSHTRFSLAKNILSLEGKRDCFDLHFTGMFKPALSDSTFELVFKEELIPSCEVGALVLLVKIFLGLFLIGALILGHNISHFALLLNEYNPIQLIPLFICQRYKPSLDYRTLTIFC